MVNTVNTATILLSLMVNMNMSKVNLKGEGQGTMMTRGKEGDSKMPMRKVRMLIQTPMKDIRLMNRITKHKDTDKTMVRCTEDTGDSLIRDSMTMRTINKGTISSITINTTRGTYLPLPKSILAIQGKRQR